MATSKQILKKNRKEAKETLKTLHNQIFVTAEDIMENSVASGVKFQKLALKAIKKSEPLMNKQVDIMFDALEEIQSQFSTGSKRFQKLVGLDAKAMKKINKAAMKVAMTVGTNVENAKKIVKKAKAAGQDLLGAAPKSAKEAKATVTNTAKKVTAKKAAAKKTTAKKIATAKKAATKKVAVAKKTATKKVATAKKAVAKVSPKKVVKATKKVVPSTGDDLTAILGVGPKVASLMKAQGFNTLNSVAKASITKLEMVKKAAGPRFTNFDVNNWKSEAVNAMNKVAK